MNRWLVCGLINSEMCFNVAEKTTGKSIERTAPVANEMSQDTTGAGSSLLSITTLYGFNWLWMSLVIIVGSTVYLTYWGKKYTSNPAVTKGMVNMWLHAWYAPSSFVLTFRCHTAYQTFTKWLHSYSW